MHVAWWEPQRKHGRLGTVGYQYAMSIMNSITYSSSLYILFLNICVWDCECENKMELNYLDILGFAMSFLRAEATSAPMVHMLFWIPGILFNIDLGHKPGKNKFLLLSKKSLFELRRPEPITSSRPDPFLGNFMWNSVGFTRKNNFYTL